MHYKCMRRRAGEGSKITLTYTTRDNLTLTTWVAILTQLQPPDIRGLEVHSGSSVQCQ